MANVDTQIASTILTQLGGAGRLRMFTGAYNFVALENGVVFRIKNARANVIKITLNGLDLYDLEVGRMRGTTYKVVLNEENVYNDMLKPMIEKATGMYLSFEKGGAIKNKMAEKVGEKKYFVVSAKDGKVVSKGFDTEEKAKAEMYKMFEKTKDFSYAIKKMAKGGGVGDDDNFQFVIIVHSDLGDDTYTITATDGVQAVHEAKYLFKKENPQYKGSISTSVSDKYAKGGYMAKGGKTYAIIYFSDKKPIARRYNSSYKAFSDYESQGSVYAELYDSRGIFISAYPKGGKEKAKYVKGGYMAKGGNIQYYVAVGETKDGYWSVMSRPTYSKKIAKMLSEGVPKGEVGKVVTLEEARKHKKLIGGQYLTDEMLAKPSTYDPPSNLDHKKMAKGGKTKLVDISDNDSRAYSEKYEVHLNDKIVGRVYKLINGKHKALNSGWENKFPEKEFDNKKDAVDYVKQQVSKMAKGGKMDRIKNWMLKGVSVGKKVGKKAYEGGKSLAKKGIEKGIEKSKQAVKEGKRKIALQVIDATKDKVATNQKVHLKASEKLVRNKYAKGGGVGLTKGDRVELLNGMKAKIISSSGKFYLVETDEKYGKDKINVPKEQVKKYATGGAVSSSNSWNYTIGGL